MDRETSKEIFDLFVDDKFTSAEEKIRNVFIKERDHILYNKLNLEQEEPEEPSEEEPEEEEEEAKKKKKKEELEKEED